MAKARKVLSEMTHFFTAFTTYKHKNDTVTSFALQLKKHSSYSFHNFYDHSGLLHQNKKFKR